MRRFTSAVALVAFGLSGVSAVRAQQRTQRRAPRTQRNPLLERRAPDRDNPRVYRRQTEIASSTVNTYLNRSGLNIYGTRRTSGLVTRPDRIRRLLAKRFKGESEEGGLVRPERPIANPIAREFRRHNLLRSRSVLARRVTALVDQGNLLRGRRFVGPAGAVTPPIDVPPGYRPEPDPNRPTYADKVASRLEDKAEDYFNRGLAFCRKGLAAKDRQVRGSSLLRAQQFFELTKQIDEDRARAYAAIAIVAFAREDSNTAVANLEAALDRAHSLADIGVDWRMFYENEERFQQVFERVNGIANANPDSASASLMLAYFAWLGGELSTAITAAEFAKSATEPEAPQINDRPDLARSDLQETGVARFYRLLVEARAGPVPSAEIGG